LQSAQGFAGCYKQPVKAKSLAPSIGAKQREGLTSASILRTDK